MCPEDSLKGSALTIAQLPLIDLLVANIYMENDIKNSYLILIGAEQVAEIWSKQHGDFL